MTPPVLLASADSRPIAPLPLPNVLVTGVSGLIGEATATHLATTGRKVVGVSRGPGERPTLAELRTALPFVQLHQGDLANREVASRLCAKVREVVHLAGSSGVVASFADPFDNLDGNTRPFLNVLTSCRPGTRVVLVSTQLVYGGGGEAPYTEDSPARPESPYAAHRLLLEQYGRMFAHRERLEVVVLRLGNVFGEVLSLDRDRSHGVVARMLTDLVVDGEARLLGGGHQKIQLVHANDVARAIGEVLTRPLRPGGFSVFNIAGESISVAEIAELLAEGLGRGRLIELSWPPGMEAAVARDIELDGDRFCTTSGWRCRFPVRRELLHLGRVWRHHGVRAIAARS
ncbi:MAG: NAD-dependent epimerase/dehydratase family protein [Acidimicrobiales bacterium]